jgi:hypothetical protein
MSSRHGKSGLFCEAPGIFLRQDRIIQHGLTGQKRIVLDTSQSIAIVIAIVAGSVSFLGLLHRVWPNEQRKLHNELIGWQVTVLGTTYAVIVGFMLYAVWTDFQAANSNAEAEANSLTNVVRTAEGLPAEQRQQIVDLARGYAEVMLSQEWPAMARVQVSPASHEIMVRLWRVVATTKVTDAGEQTSLDHTLTELSELAKHRRARQLDVDSSLPPILWGVLIVGAIVTIVSACMFGSADFKVHFLQVFMLSLLVALALVAIADINRPFQGSVHVPPSGFERARAVLAAISAADSH